MTIAGDVAILHSDPCRATAGLLEKVDDAVVISCVNACLAREAQVRHTGDVGQLTRRLCLQVASPACECIITHPSLIKLSVVADWGIVAEVSVGQPPQAEVRARIQRRAVVPEGLRAVLKVDVASDVLRAVIGDDDRVLGTGGVRDEV